MKKIVGFVLALSVVAAAFISCGSDDDGGVLDNIETYGDQQTTAYDNAEEENTTADIDNDETTEEVLLENSPVDLIEGFESVRLLPVNITADRFETEILSHITDEDDKAVLNSYYTLYDINKEGLDEEAKKSILAAFPICEKYAVYVCAPDLSNKEADMLCDIIAKYCPDYSYEDLARDSEECGYTQEQVMDLRQK